MAQYQSFPGAPGDSLTLEKLKLLSLPDLAGRSFLDVGCNEGFFCGFARSQGAGRVVGIDHSAGYIARARERFPDCEFHARGWDALPEGPFDVILLASALHYADDQEALLHRLASLLTLDGVLVVELGIFSSKNSEWVNVKRGSDQRLFPTMPKLRELLVDYAWKWMGPSVSQSGDPVGRHVIHISRRRPAAYLLMQPPAYGKSSIAKSLFPKAGVPHLSGDLLIGQIAASKLKAPDALTQAIVECHSPFQLDQTIQRIFERGLAGELVELWLSKAGGKDFALDMYVPAEFQPRVRELVGKAGYLPVVLDWERPGPRFVPRDVAAERAEAFYLSMNKGPVSTPSGAGGMVGFVDEMVVSAGTVRVRGWASDANGNVPDSISLTLAGRRFEMKAFEKELRPDVQRHRDLPHALVGFRGTIEVPGIEGFADMGGNVVVKGMAATSGDNPAFTLSAALEKQLKDA